MALAELCSARINLQVDPSPATCASALLACNDAVLVFLNTCLGGQRRQMFAEMTAENLVLFVGTYSQPEPIFNLILFEQTRTGIRYGT